MADSVKAGKVRRPFRKIEIAGIALVVASLVLLMFKPEWIAGIFNAMVDKAVPTVVKVFLTGSVGVAIICSVMMGRILERCGFTDALMRMFLPAAKLIGVNPAVIIPAVYNILGDINAAGKISGPILQKAGATKDEQKIAICTMVQSQQSFSTFMFGLVALTAVGVRAFPVVILAIFLPLVVVPLLLRLTIWRKTKAVDLSEVPSFTPTNSPLAMIFDAAREGANILFLLVIPAVAAIFAIIGALDYVGVWKPVEAGLGAMLQALAIDPETGMISILSSPTLAMAKLKDVAATMDPRFVVGSFVLAASGFPFSVIFGQIPTIWSSCSDLSHREAMGAAVLGVVMRLLTAGFMALVLTPLFVM